MVAYEGVYDICHGVVEVADIARTGVDPRLKVPHPVLDEADEVRPDFLK